MFNLINRGFLAPWWFINDPIQLSYLTWRNWTSSKKLSPILLKMLRFQKKKSDKFKITNSRNIMILSSPPRKVVNLKERYSYHSCIKTAPRYNCLPIMRLELLEMPMILRPIFHHINPKMRGRLNQQIFRKVKVWDQIHAVQNKDTTSL
jgi:hypothetical protein